MCRETGYDKPVRRTDAGEGQTVAAGKRMYCQALNAERNRELLKSVPHERVEDLAFIVRCRNNPALGTAITYDLCRDLGLSREDLFRIAKENSRKSGYQCRRGIGYIPYVLTNSRGFCGASALLFDDILQKTCAMLGESFYILPGSIHELFLLPESFVKGAWTPEELKRITEKVSRITTSEESYLSDNVYHYDGETESLTLTGTAPGFAR